MKEIKTMVETIREKTDNSRTLGNTEFVDHFVRGKYKNFSIVAPYEVVFGAGQKNRVALKRVGQAG